MLDKLDRLEQFRLLGSTLRGSLTVIVVVGIDAANGCPFCPLIWMGWKNICRYVQFLEKVLLLLFVVIFIVSDS